MSDGFFPFEYEDHVRVDPAEPEKCYRCGKKPPPGRKSRIIEGMRVCSNCERPKMNTP